ncbi:MAG: hypothetical protein LBP75_00340 [Planctomycetota bacterium]|jgi:hypothetical protein|nr:hypothetical protein [Planctomycetota bacterium]
MFVQIHNLGICLAALFIRDRAKRKAFRERHLIPFPTYSRRQIYDALFPRHRYPPHFIRAEQICGGGGRLVHERRHRR